MTVADPMVAAGGAEGLRLAARAAALHGLPTPGRGRTVERFRALTQIARDDLEVARVVEAHTDALAIAAEMNASLRADSLYGVWAASGPDPLLAERAPHDSTWSLHGNLPWCTGVGVVQRALVSARTGAGPVLVDVAVDDGREIRSAATWASPAFAITNTATLRFDIDGIADAQVIGGPGEYLTRPGFWHGAIGVAACWAGGALGLLDLQTTRWKRSDEHSLAHLGAAHAWASALTSVLDAAAAEIDADPNGYATAEVRARGVRHVVERMCTQIVDELGVGAGPEPLAFDEPILRRTQQLQLYIRQCHGERDLVPLGRAILDSRPSTAT